MTAHRITLDHVEQANQRSRAGLFSPVQFDRAMTAPDGPIIPETVHSVRRAPEEVVRLTGISLSLSSQFALFFEGHDSGGDYLVVEEDEERGERLRQWRLLNRVRGEAVFGKLVGLLGGKPVWSKPAPIDPSDFSDTLYLEHRPLFSDDLKHLSWSRHDGILPHLDRLYVWAHDAKSETPTCGTLLIFTSDGKLERLVETNWVLPVHALAMSFDGQIVAGAHAGDFKIFFPENQSTSYVTLDCDGDDRFLGFVCSGSETKAMILTKKGRQIRFYPLNGRDPSAAPAPTGEICGHYYIGPQHLVWKVRRDDKMEYVIGTESQRARFDLITEPFKCDGRWWYYGLSGRHVCRTELILP